VESTLSRLARNGGFTEKLARQPGFKEARHGHLLCGKIEPGEEPPPQSAPERGPSDRDRIAALEASLAEFPPRVRRLPPQLRI